MGNRDRIALLDLDGTVADYDKSLRYEHEKLRAPGEEEYRARYAEEVEPPYMENRRALITRRREFWTKLERIELGFAILAELRRIGFVIHVLTKGPKNNHNAWAGKVEWCRQHLPDALVTITQDKSIAYGRVLIDDFPPYFTNWAAVRPRGLVVCVAQPWNAEFAEGGERQHSQVLRYDGLNLVELRKELEYQYMREGGKS